MDLVVNLRGVVATKFGSISKFAREIGWCYSKANRIVNGKQEPSASEIKSMIQVLGVGDPEVISFIFLN